jgi:hypothetical protein
MGLTKDKHPSNRPPELDYSPRKKLFGNTQLGPSTSGQNQGTQKTKATRAEAG